jgi:hypothetical protein
MFSHYYCKNYLVAHHYSSLGRIVGESINRRLNEALYHFLGHLHILLWLMLHTAKIETSSPERESELANLRDRK